MRQHVTLRLQLPEIDGLYRGAHQKIHLDNPNPAQNRWRIIGSIGREL